MLLPTGQSIEQKIASLIVYMITPSNGVQRHLEALLNAMRGYFHPSNHGSWSAFLGVIVHKLGECFARRLHEERQPDCVTPPDCRLTPANCREFCQTMVPVFHLSMFGKGSVHNIPVVVLHLVCCLLWWKSKPGRFADEVLIRIRGKLV
jgi:proteasome activator subunit 4